MDVFQDRNQRGILDGVLRALIVGNGTLPSKHLVEMEIECANYVLAADGGANAIHRLGLTCDAIIGDFDSVDAESLPDVERIPAPDQNHTDLDKAIAHVISLGYAEAAIMGVTGNRLDHTFGALEMLARFGRDIPLRLIDDIGCAFLVTGDRTYGTKPGQTVSLLPLGVVEGVTTDGLQWALSGERLSPATRDGISNVATGESVVIQVKSGDLIAYFHQAAVCRATSLTTVY